jgi:hypothetical protein
MDLDQKGLLLVHIWLRLCEWSPLKGSGRTLTIFVNSTVYFNPAKTAGAMIEADLFCLMGLVYSAFVCGISMSMYWWLELKPGFEWLGDVLAILWIGLSMSLVAWMKVWMVGHHHDVLHTATRCLSPRLAHLSTLLVV